jgi:peptide/nickel transport system substrate-binding protein
MLADKVPALSLFTSVRVHAIDSSLEGLFIFPDGSIDASTATFA